MARLLHELRESDYRCREALHDPRLRLELVGNRRIRRRAQRRWIQAKGHLELCIRKLIREALLYHLICEIEKEHGRSFEFSVVSREIDVIVIEVMITLFPYFLFMVTSCIDLVGRFQHYDVFPEIQDGDRPRKYRLYRGLRLLYLTTVNFVLVLLCELTRYVNQPISLYDEFLMMFAVYFFIYSFIILFSFSCYSMSYSSYSSSSFSPD
ncbi:uncharacterized protein LOC126718458 [Quercus robur]|uniref:uncharacterized protein LOC126718458 n=1 Tax=Quercus robur TaxID=38942 RepID=UPI002162705F|nr:uncharacterized protein LOC126718458 [Quercus robur]